MKNLLLMILTAPLLCFGGDLYEAVEPLEFDPAGYFATASSLDEIFREKKITTVIEIGSWAGASTRFFGHRVEEGGTVYAVDHWLGTSSHRGEMTDPKRDRIYHIFLSNIRSAGLADRIIPVRMNSEEAARALQVSADLIYIDAGRDEGSVYRDIMQWSTHLEEDGILCGAEYREPGIRKGVQRAASALGLNVSSDRKGYFWKLVSE